MKRALVLASSIAITCMMHLIACDDPVSHPYAGQLFIDGRACLGGPSTIDVVDGPPTGSCPATCLVAFGAGGPGDGGRATYVATTCPPFPPDYDSAGKDPSCASALAAFARDDQCLPDGGSTHPDAAAPTDAAAD